MPSNATAIAVDGSSNVYVTGNSWGSGNSDYATVKYNSAGEQQWVARYNGEANNGDFATAIAVDKSGNVYVTGYSGDDYVTGISLGLDTVIDFVTVKYDTLGQEQWVARYNNGGGRAIALDSSGNVYVTGYSNDPRTGTEYATIKYNPVGQEQWVARYNGSANDSDQAAAIPVDGVGNVYVAGMSTGWGRFWDYAIIKYQQLPAGPPRPMVLR